MTVITTEAIGQVVLKIYSKNLVAGLYEPIHEKKEV
jgi:hypothetical protein